MAFRNARYMGLNYYDPRLNFFFVKIHKKQNTTVDNNKSTMYRSIRTSTCITLFL